VIAQSQTPDIIDWSFMVAKLCMIIESDFSLKITTSIIAVVLLLS